MVNIFYVRLKNYEFFQIRFRYLFINIFATHGEKLDRSCFWRLGGFFVLLHEEKSLDKFYIYTICIQVERLKGRDNNPYIWSTFLTMLTWLENWDEMITSNNHGPSQDNFDQTKKGDYSPDSHYFRRTSKSFKRADH